MPSAANVKIEKAPENMGVAVTATPVADGNTAAVTVANNNPQQQPPAQATNNTPMPPIRQAITVIEHKIRNMEKRKSKLESYREVQRSGKDLNADQKSAVAKYDEVVQTLEFARDLCKQFLGIAVVSDKDDKKRLRKEALARSQGELTKIREVLLVQDALSNMVSETAREDFLQGKNGAALLTQTDLKLLDDLYSVATPKHASGNPSQFMPQVQAAAEHLQAVVDGKQKEAFGSTYSQIKEVIGKIHESGYFDQAVETFTEECVVSIECPEIVMVSTQIAPIEPIPVQQLENMTMEVRPPPPMQQPIMEQPPPQQQPPQMEQQQPPPVQMQPPVPEAMYYQQPPPPPAPRPITEVLGNGSFFFLQDSELDTPPEQIPTQTFTNQTYVSALPPPIPMPPHFHQYPNAPPQQPPQNVVASQPMQQVPPPQQLQQQQQQQQQQPPQPQQVPPVQQQQQQIHQQQQQPPMVMPQHVVPPAQTNNGIGERHPEVHEDMNRQRRQQRGPPTNNHHQPFFPNNNGYNNRPRNNNRNNGPRPNNNRHNQPL
ncbi:PREDICTED: caprin homolog [Nicrophorus vespilloides]|uniref:Caprin homolog n=1 Tax=Nicrophorus vespilloides TaxID=110193 RepID=A0ABM1N830_NICVS|nr:PREDICTED: caprin homolog [Nicrophorus vespilloides]